MPPQPNDSPHTPTVDIESAPDLIAYLQRTGRLDPGEEPQVQVLQGGVSNRTVLVKRPNGEGWVLKQALAKLRVKVDWFSSPERIQREALGTRWLPELAGAGTVPALIFQDPAEYILAMQAVPEPHANWKTMLLRGELHTDHIRQFGELLGHIHRHSYERRAEMAVLFEDRQFFETLRLEPYYSYSAVQVPSAAPFINTLIQDTRQTRLTIVHGDYSPKNVLVHQDRLILLDHEVIHFGDPAFDVGFSLTHLLSKAHHLPPHRAAFLAAAEHYWQIYYQVLQGLPWANAEFEARSVRHTLACLLARVAGRSQLEYLSEGEKDRQQAIVLALLMETPQQIPDLIRRFGAALQNVSNG